MEFEPGEHERHWPAGATRHGDQRSARPRDGGSPVPSPTQLPAEPQSNRHRLRQAQLVGPAGLAPGARQMRVRAGGLTGPR